ncbi:hypothetical protein Tco_0974838 [Tanacetum coccineum]|uniref:Uncharacterized protein n=1 Tax=Tanacetum coccineum TaxID=301880 RepID=A0ABQ5ECU4_9ASTR
MAPKTFSSKLRQHHRWLSKKEVDIGLPKLKYVQDATCSSCEALSRHPPSSSGMTETERQSDLQSGKCDHTERFRSAQNFKSGTRYKPFGNERNQAKEVMAKQKDEYQTDIATKQTTCSRRVMCVSGSRVLISKNPFSPVARLEEVYVAQPDGFVDPDHPENVYRLRKALYA